MKCPPLLQVILALPLFGFCSFVAEAQQTPPAALKIHDRVLRSTNGDLQAARSAALNTWIEEVEAGRAAPSATLNLEMQRQFGPNAKQYDLPEAQQQLRLQPQQPAVAPRRTISPNTLRHSEEVPLREVFNAPDVEAAQFTRVRFT